MDEFIPVSRTPVIANDLLGLAQDILNAQYEIGSGLASNRQAGVYARNSFDLANRQLQTAFDRGYQGLTGSLAASGFGNSGSTARAIERAFEDQQLATDSLGLEYQNTTAQLALQEQALQRYLQQLSVLAGDYSVYNELYSGARSGSAPYDPAAQFAAAPVARTFDPRVLA